MVVLAVTVAMAIFLGLADFVFGWLMAGILDLSPVAIAVSVVIVAGMGVAGYLLLREE